MLLVAMSTGSNKDLVRQIAYLKTEVEILRGKLPPRLTFTPGERRRLIRAGRHLGSMLRKLVTIVHPDTLLRWIRAESNAPKKSGTTRRGRRRTDAQIQRLILKLARENAWGYARILGELKKLGISRISKSTVKRILKAGGYDTQPRRGHGSWDEFVKRHAISLWQCDFLSRRVVTCTGFRDAFVLVFLHVKTRQVIVSPATLAPDDAWVRHESQRFVTTARERRLRVRLLQHDCDRKFSRAFRALMKSRRVTTLRNPKVAPVMNAFVERFIQSIQQECLDQFLIFGTRHLDHLAREYLAHYHEERPHQGLDNDRILAPPRLRTREPDEPMSLSSVRRKSRLGGLLKSYYRRAA